MAYQISGLLPPQAQALAQMPYFTAPPTDIHTEHLCDIALSPLEIAHQLKSASYQEALELYKFTRQQCRDFAAIRREALERIKYLQP